MTEAAHGFLLRDLAIVMMVAGLVTLSFHRLRQPVVLGYIVAGVIIGPHTPPFPLVRDRASIETLGELGMVLLMFSLGLGFSFRQLRRVGVAASIAATLEILLMLWVGYEVGRFFGWSRMDSIFLGAILSISSTTIIVKVLTELDKTRAKFAELIFGILIVEDILAIALIALLSSVALTGSLAAGEVLGALGRIGVFLIVALVTGLIAVPPLLRYVARYKSDEMMLVTALALCFGFALLAVTLGYSVALGAFVIGSIIGEAREAGKVRELTGPLRDMFSAVFFVAAGMMLDPALLAKHAVPVAVITVAVVMGKVLTCSFGAFVAGYDTRTSLRVGMGLAQIGEFSFIIATLGLTLKVTSDFLYPIAVCVSAVTTLLTPYLIRSADDAVNWLDRAAPRGWIHYLELYTRWAQRLAASQSANPARQLARKWVWQMGLNVVLATGIFLAAAAIARNVEAWWPNAPAWIGGAKGVLWIGAGLLALPALIATVRKLQALAMLLAETTGSNRPASTAVISNVIWLAGSALLGLWILVVSAPFLPAWPGLLVPVVIVAMLTGLLWRFFIRIHAKAQWALREALAEPPPPPESGPLETVLKNAQLEALPVAPESPAAGKLISELELRSKTGASIVAIERDGDNIINPDASEELRPGDRLFLLGTSEQIAAARQLLSR